MPEAARFAINGRFLGQSQTGVQRYAFNVVKAMSAELQARGQQAQLLAPRGTPDPRLANLVLTHTGNLKGHGWEQISLPASWTGALLNLSNTGPAFRSDQIVCIHDANVHTAPESYSFAFRNFYRALQPRLARVARSITTVSASAAEQIARVLPVRLADIAVMPNGHEHAKDWKPEAAELAPRLFEGPHALHENGYVLAIGSRARHKNLALLAGLSNALSARGLQVVIAGGDASHFSDTEALPSSIRLTGRVTDDDLAYLMDRAFFLAFPSITEGFGLPIVEAMARGCPVISSDRASMPEVCGDAALMAAPDDPAAWLAQIDRLRASSQLRAELIERGYAQVTKFSWRKTASDYLSLLDACSERSR